jgi:hypothetical protein
MSRSVSNRALISLTASKAIGDRRGFLSKPGHALHANLLTLLKFNFCQDRFGRRGDCGLCVQSGGRNGYDDWRNEPHRACLSEIPSSESLRAQLSAMGPEIIGVNATGSMLQRLNGKNTGLRFPRAVAQAWQ